MKNDFFTGINDFTGMTKEHGYGRGLASGASMFEKSIAADGFGFADGEGFSSKTWSEKQPF